MNKLKPALLGGLISGILSVIPILNNCCCIWAALGGLLASFLYIRGSALPVSTGDGAIVGALSGLFGGILYLVLGIPLALLLGTGAQVEGYMRQSGLEVPLTGIALVLITAILVVAMILIFASLGGLIGVPIFEKRKGQSAPPPPPQNFGGGYGPTS